MPSVLAGYSWATFSIVASIAAFCSAVISASSVVCVVSEVAAASVEVPESSPTDSSFSCMQKRRPPPSASPPRFLRIPKTRLPPRFAGTLTGAVSARLSTLAVRADRPAPARDRCTPPGIP